MGGRDAGGDSDEEWWEDLTKTSIKRKLRKCYPDLPVCMANPKAYSRRDTSVPKAFGEHFTAAGMDASEGCPARKAAGIHHEAELLAGLPSVDVRKAQLGLPIREEDWPAVDPVRGEGRSIEDIISTRRNNPSAQRAVSQLFPTTKLKPAVQDPFSKAKAAHNRLQSRAAQASTATGKPPIVRTPLVAQASQTRDMCTSPTPGAAKYLLRKHKGEGHILFSPADGSSPTPPLPSSPTDTRPPISPKPANIMSQSTQQQPHFVEVVLGQSVVPPEEREVIPLKINRPASAPTIKAMQQMNMLAEGKQEEEGRNVGIDFQPEQYFHHTRIMPGTMPKSWTRPSSAELPAVPCEVPLVPNAVKVAPQSEFSKKFSKPKINSVAGSVASVIPGAWTPVDTPKTTEMHGAKSLLIPSLSASETSTTGTSQPASPSSTLPALSARTADDVPKEPMVSPKGEETASLPAPLADGTNCEGQSVATRPSVSRSMKESSLATPSVVVIGHDLKEQSLVTGDAISLSRSGTGTVLDTPVSTGSKTPIQTPMHERRRVSAPTSLRILKSPRSSSSSSPASAFARSSVDNTSLSPMVVNADDPGAEHLQEYVGPNSPAAGIENSLNDGSLTLSHTLSNSQLSLKSVGTPADDPLMSSRIKRFRTSLFKKKLGKLRVLTSTLQAFRAAPVTNVPKLRRSDANLAPSAPFHAPLSRPGNEGLRARRGVLHAVVVGISMYDDARLLPCHQAAGDAMLLAMILKSAGYTVTELHDGPDSQRPTKPNILAAVREARENCKNKQDICLLVFIGLGHISTSLVDSMYRGPSGINKPELHLLTKEFDVGRQDAERPGFIRMSQLMEFMEHEGEEIPLPVIMCDTVSCYGKLRRAPQHLDTSGPVHGYIYVGGRSSIGGSFTCHCPARYNFLASYYFRKALLGHATREFRVTTNTFNVYLDRKLKKRGYEHITTSASSLNGGDVVLIERHEVAYDKKEIKDLNESSKSRPNKIVIGCFVPRLKYDATDAAFGQTVASTITKLISRKASVASPMNLRARRTSRISISLLVRQVYMYNTTIISMKSSPEQVMLNKREQQLSLGPIIDELREACDQSVDASFFLKGGCAMLQVHSKRLSENKNFEQLLIHTPEPPSPVLQPVRKRVGSVNFVADPDNFTPSPLLFFGEENRRTSIFDRPRRRSSILPPEKIASLTPAGRALEQDAVVSSLAFDSPSMPALNPHIKRRKSVREEKQISTRPLGGQTMVDAWDHCAVTLHGSEWHYNKIDKYMRAGDLGHMLMPFSLRRMPYSGAEVKLDRAATKIQAIRRGFCVRRVWVARWVIRDNEKSERQTTEDTRYNWLCCKKTELKQELRNEVSKREKRIRHDKEVWEWEERELIYQSMARSMCRSATVIRSQITEEEDVFSHYLSEMSSRLLITHTYHADRRWFLKQAKFWTTFATSREKVERECYYAFMKFSWKHGSAMSPL